MGDDDIDTILYNITTLILQVQIFYWEKFKKSSAIIDLHEPKYLLIDTDRVNYWMIVV